MKFTQADISQKQDWSDPVGAYLSIIVRDEPAVSYALATPTNLDPDELIPACGYWDVEIFSNKAGVVDAQAFDELAQEADEIPDEWWDIAKEKGVASITLPNSDATLAITPSGYLGDEGCPVVYAYNAAGELVACHLDFQVVGNKQYEI